MQLRSHVQLERHVRRQPRVDLHVLMCLAECHEMIKLLWNEGAPGPRRFAEARDLHPLHCAEQLVDAAHVRRATFPGNLGPPVVIV